MALTKSQLAAENAALRIENETLRLQMQNMASVASAVNTMHHKAAYVTPYEMPQWQKDRAVCMAEAKELAMFHNTTVKA